MLIIIRVSCQPTQLETVVCQERKNGIEQVEGNFRLCHHVSEDLISLLISANLKYGRRARWLDALEVFLECNGKADGLKNNQDLILRLLLEDKQVLLDFTCDYTDSSANVRIPQALRSNDSRRGLDRIGLMLEHDHLKQFRSLLKFHVTSLRLLAMCTAGKNQGTKDTCAHIPEIHLEQCIDNYLDVDLRSDGVREARLDLDVIFYVQTPYVQLINNVYLTSAQASAARLVQENYRWWPIDTAAEILRIRCPPSAVTPRLATCHTAARDMSHRGLCHVTPRLVTCHTSAHDMSHGGS